MFDRPSTGELAVLVHLPLQLDHEDLAELNDLALSAGALPVGTVIGRRCLPEPKYFIGTGKLEELRNKIRDVNASLVLFNHELSPRQERNLEQALSVRVVDRNSLILDIFAQRAQSFEGKLQVELAQLRHVSTRLVRGLTHLERQKGGIGLRGPGETQLETDRRLIGIRIRRIQQRLVKVVKRRQQGRRARKKADIRTVALVGYTNAGKSSLFNALTGSKQYAEEQLFATLDPSLRRYTLSNGCTAILVDTVGFIRHLPHDLIAAFRSTLLETIEADVLLHVIDASAQDRDDKILQVNEVLADIGASEIPQIKVYNKIDRLDGVRSKVGRNKEGRNDRVWLSARTGDGLSILRKALTDRLNQYQVRRSVHLLPSQGRLRAKLYDLANVVHEKADNAGGWDIEIEIHKKNLGLLAGIDS